MHVSKSYVKNLIGKEPEAYGTFYGNINYKPLNNTSSWSKDFDTAKEFATEGKTEYCLILIADVSANNDRIIDVESIYNLHPDMKRMRFEEEAIIMGIVKVESVLYADKSTVRNGEDVFGALLDGAEIEV